MIDDEVSAGGGEKEGSEIKTGRRDIYQPGCIYVCFIEVCV